MRATLEWQRQALTGDTPETKKAAACAVALRLHDLMLVSQDTLARVRVSSSLISSFLRLSAAM